MFVNKFKIRSEAITGNTIQLPITISQEHNFHGQTEIIQNEFVDVERKKAINPIVDYEKIRFLPAHINNSLLNTVEYKVNLFSDGAHQDSEWVDLGLTQEDIKFRKNRFKKSFLRLAFYDSSSLLSQIPIYTTTFFPQVTAFEPISSSSKIIFKRENPIKNPNGFAEGFYQYWFKDLVNINEDYELFMRAEFLNAVDGKTTPLMFFDGIPDYDDEFKEKIHLKYTFKKTSENYLYTIEPLYSPSPAIEYLDTNKRIRVNLYESVVV